MATYANPGRYRGFQDHECSGSAGPRAGADTPVRPRRIRCEVQYARSRRAIGQAITVNLPAFGISKQLVIKRVEAVGYAPGANAMLEYQVECIGSDNVTFTDLMTMILQTEANQTTVDDSTVNENLVSVAEAIAVTEAVSIIGVLAIAKYGPTSPQPRYGFARYS